MKIKLARLLLAFFILQSILLGGITYFFELSKYSFYTFFMFTVLWHFVIYFYLTSHMETFYKTETAEKLTDVNLANSISLFRASSVMTVGFLIWYCEHETILILAVCFTVIIFISDALDGIVARKKKEITGLGKMIDSMSDYALLTFMSALFYEKEILPLWFFWLLFMRFFIQSYGMVKFIALNYPMEPKSTIGGKITIAGTMTLYFLALISLLFKNELFNKFLQISLVLCALVIFIFMFEKIFIFYKHWQKYKKHKQNKSTENPEK
ncbi:MAG: CDP-alcohol phosphatidyltransferase family protein [Treponemataceae bacterium]